MFFWWIGGLFLFGAVVCAAVRLGTHYVRSTDCEYYERLFHPRDCRGDDRRYYDENDCYRKRYERYRGNDR